MKGPWRRVGGLLLTVCCALGFGFVGVRWLTRALRADGGPEGFLLACALAWLAGAALWAVRAVREHRRLPKPERTGAAAAVNALLLAACAAVWLYLGAARRHGLALAAGLVWLACALLQTVRAARLVLRAPEDEKTDENDHVNIGGNDHV